MDENETPANAPEATIGTDPGIDVGALQRELEQLRAELELERNRRELARVRRVGPAAPIFLDHRWAECTCGHVDVYPIKRTLRGKGSSSKDPGRLKNIACNGCRKRLGYGAHKRAQRWTLEERRAMRRLQNEIARQQRSVEVSLTGAGRGSPGPKRRVPAKTSVAEGCSRASRRPPLCCAHHGDARALYHCMRPRCGCAGFQRCSVR